MKYIVTKNEEGEEEIFTFPRSVNHDCMSEVLNKVKNQTWGDWRRVRREVVSAGFINSQGECYGESITLHVTMREGDTELYRKLQAGEM